MHDRFIRILRSFVILMVGLCLPAHSYAGLIRDAEVESTVRLYANPIFEEAGIPPEDVRIFINADPSINAFVAGGLNIFFNTGLIRATTKPSELIGVIAHETGHISGAHLSQLREKSNRALLGSIIGVLAGAAAAAGGASDAAGGLILGSTQLSQRQFLSEIRVNESSADQAALKFLDALDISSTGMLSLFETLRRNESGLPGSRDRYLRSHPLTSERINAMRNHIDQSEIPADQVPEGFAARHARMVAKLAAFLEPYAVTLKLYPESDTSVAARYARAIAAFRNQRTSEAVAGMNALIKEFPKDPYFYDTKGQILFETGNLVEAEKAYARASTLQANSALILTDYAKTIIAQNNPKALPRAIALLERSRELDDSYTNTWRELAIAYGKQGRLGLSYAALAEEASLQGQHKEVLQHVARARSFTKEAASLRFVLDDLERDAKEQLKRRDDKGLF